MKSLGILCKIQQNNLTAKTSWKWGNGLNIYDSEKKDPKGRSAPTPGQYTRVATVREKVWKMKFFPDQGKVREFGFESGKIGKSAKVREKSGNFKIFSKGMVFGNVSMS